MPHSSPLLLAWVKRYFFPRGCLWPALLCWGAVFLGGCAPAWQAPGLADLELQPGRYIKRSYRSPEFVPTAGAYQVQTFPVDQVRGISSGTAQTLFNEELLRALQANGLRVNQAGPTFALDGQVHRFAVASPVWRFVSGRGQAHLRVAGEIRRGQEIVFAFQDDIDIAPAVNPRHQPPLEPDLIARLAARRFAVNLLNEMLLPPGLRSPEERENHPTPGPPR